MPGTRTGGVKKKRGYTPKGSSRKRVNRQLSYTMGRSRSRTGRQMLNQPFPNITKRILTYAFRDQIQPPATTTGGYSVASARYAVNNPYDIDEKNLATVTAGARMNHQPMGYDQLGALYDHQRVDWVKMRINFAVEKPTQFLTQTEYPAGTTTGTQRASVPIRVAVLCTTSDTLDPSLLVQVSGTVSFEKLIEQSKSGMLPAGTALVYSTLTSDRVIHLEKGINCYKMIKAQREEASFADWKEDNTKQFENYPPQDKIYFHIIASPISVTPGDTHPKVTFYGDMSLGMTFSKLKEFGQSS